MNAPAIDIKLTESERQSPAWRTIKTKIDAQLEKLRRQNDNPSLTDVETATLRGHIACLKVLATLDTVPPAVPAERPVLARAARTGTWSE